MHQDYICYLNFPTNYISLDVYLNQKYSLYAGYNDNPLSLLEMYFNVFICA